MTADERSELIAIAHDLRFRLAKLSGTVDYLTDALDVPPSVQGGPAVPVESRTRPACPPTRLERCQGHLRRSRKTARQAQKPSTAPE
jgi:hypothetical protein